MQWMLILLVILGGMGLSVEAGLLGPLGGEVGDLWATFSIFGTGAALTFLLMLFFSPRNSPSFFAQPTWQLLGGVLGPVYVVILILATPAIGIALTMIGILAGQVFKSLSLTTLGCWAPRPERLTVNASSRCFSSLPRWFWLHRGNKMTLIMIMLAVCGGATLSIQAAINGQLGSSVGVFKSAFLTFSVGALVTALLIFFFEPKQAVTLMDVPKWQLLGALFGVPYIVIMVLAVQRIGTAVATVAVIFGQLTMSMLIDSFGWLGNAVIPFSLSRLGAIVCLAIALIFIYLSSKTPAEPVPESE